MLNPNLHKVPKSPWKKWSAEAQNIFNEVYELMKTNQNLFSHPKAAVQQAEFWDTTAWNAAWTAADAVNKYTRTPK